MKINLFFLLSFLCLQSCAIYSPYFECPPGKGVPCTAVSTIEKMIIETQEGPDLFLGEETHKDCLKLQTLGQTSTRCSKECGQRKIWVEEHIAEDGSIVGGHYVYLGNG